MAGDPEDRSEPQPRADASTRAPARAVPAARVPASGLAVGEQPTLTPSEAPPAEPEQLLVEGTQVDHFRVMRLIGRGGMGEVYLARDAKLGRKVALKVIRPDQLGTDRAVEQFLFEARTTARFNHPNIVSIYAVGEHEGYPYVALEHLEGQNLRERIAELPLSQQEALRIVLAVAEALTEAHANGVLHRDLKPENIFIPRDGRVRVVDFGLAHTVSRGEALDTDSAEDAAHRSITMIGAAVTGRAGTPLYMAPEQWHALESSAATDVWALGVILFELATGCFPYEEADLFAQGLAVCSSEPAPRVDQHADLPPELVELIAACLQKDSSLRPPLTEVTETLRQLLGAESKSIANLPSPFRGLMPFTERHAELFFGREAELDAFMERIRTQPILPLVGPSGSGKSSFVQAGVVPRLREQGRWQVVQLRPGARPFETLAARVLGRGGQTSQELTSELVLSEGTGSSGRRARESASEVRTSLPPNPDETAAIHSVARDLYEEPLQLSILLRALAAEQGGNVLLFVDQMEELFTLVDDEQVQQRFLQTIAQAADDPADAVRVVFTVRDDFLGRLATGPEVSEVLTGVTVLRRLEDEALAEILRRPLQAVGYGFEDEELVGEMVQAVRGEPACLPLLQFAAQMLWEQRDQKRRLLLRATYQEIGGVEGALAQHADGVLGGLSSSEERLARELLLRLVTGERTRKVLSKRAALEGLGGEAAQVLARLTSARLISVRKTRGGGRSESSLELAHESLIHTWATVGRWLDEAKEELAFLAEVGRAAELWDQRGRRPDELWQGDALADALRSLERCSTKVPEPVEAFLATARARQQRAVQRRRLLLFSAIGVLAAVAVVLGIMYREAETQRGRAEHRERQVRLQRAEALREGARAAHNAGRVLEARAKLRVALEQEDAATARALWWQLDHEPLAWRADLGAVVYDVAYSGDGAKVAAGCADGAVYVFDVHTRAMRVLRGQGDQVLSVAFTPDGKQLAAGSLDGTIRLWDLSTRRSIRVFRHGAGTFDLMFSPSGELLASAGADHKVRLWERESGEEQAVLEGHTSSVNAVCFHPNGSLVVTGGSDQKLRLWRLPEGKLVRSIQGNASSVVGVAIRADGAQIASVGADKTVRLWDPDTGEAGGVLYGHTAATRGVAYHPGGELLVSTGADATIRLWDVSTGRATRTLRGHGGVVRGVHFSPDGKLMVTAGFDRTVRIWRVDGTAHHSDPQGHDGGAYALAFHPKGTLVASGGGDRNVRLWDVASGEQRRVVQGHSQTVFALDIDATGQRLAAASGDGTVRLWALPSGAPGTVLTGHTTAVNAVRFLPDEDTLATGGFDGTVRLWSATEGKLKETLHGHKSGVYRIDYHPDGRSLVSASYDRTLRLWDLESGAATQVLRGHEDRVYGGAFSPDGTQVASGSMDHTVRLWDLDSGTDTVIGKHDARVYEVAFHPDGKRIGATSSDGIARIWSVETKSSIALHGHRGEVNTIAFSADGALTATAGDDGTVRLWHTDTGRPLWRAPVLVGEPPWILSHRGWHRLGDDDEREGGNPPGVGTKLRELVEQQARMVSIGPAAEGTPGLWCVHTYDESVEIWDAAADQRLADKRIRGLAQVVALADGCVARTQNGVLLVSRAGQSKSLPFEGQPTAIARAGEQLFVAAGTAVFAFDPAGTPLGRTTTGPGVSALAQLTVPDRGRSEDDGELSDTPTAWLAVGYHDGNVELMPFRDGEQGSTEQAFSLEQVPSSPPVRILAGPEGTLIVGYANGLLGMWSQHSGSRLGTARLHGPVVHVALQQGKLYAATELGQSLVWDLGVFYRDYCELMREVWDAVPVVWRSGRPARHQPSEHRCLTGRP